MSHAPKTCEQYVDGRFVPAASGATFPVHDPSTEEVIARVPDSGEADVERAVAAARRAFDEGPWRPIGWY